MPCGIHDRPFRFSGYEDFIAALYGIVPVAAYSVRRFQPGTGSHGFRHSGPFCKQDFGFNRQPESVFFFHGGKSEPQQFGMFGCQIHKNAECGRIAHPAGYIGV